MYKNKYNCNENYSTKLNNYLSSSVPHISSNDLEINLKLWIISFENILLYVAKR